MTVCEYCNGTGLINMVLCCYYCQLVQGVRQIKGRLKDVDETIEDRY